jgi:predicted transcriptional regulator of viral defense system
MKSESAKGVSSLESQVLALCQSRPQRTLASGELVRALRWTVDQERKVLSRLSGKGLIVRVRNGLYLVPPRLPPGGRWSPGEFLALSTLMEDRGGRYQISGPSSFYRYGWTEQVPNRVYAYNNRISGDREVGPVSFTLIKVTDDRLGGTEVVRVPEGVDVVYASKARALVDAVYDWSRFDSLPRAYAWITAEAGRDGFAAELVETAIQFGNQTTLRRIGATLERAGVAENLLRKLDRQLTPSSAYTPWIPTREKGGTTNKRWEIVFNDE